MQRTNTIRAGILLAAVLIVGAVAAYYATRSNGASSGHQARVVMTAKNAALHETILVDRNGMTLYSLSAERHGRFICTDGTCLSLWKPLLVRHGVTPTGTSGLSVVKRPDGGRQVAYAGGPLYRFTGDHARGDAKGNGFKDVGTWRVVAVGKHAAAPAPAPASSSYSRY
jgi:predicted lipoprotein with Yx(FWY)xxD motif